MLCGNADSLMQELRRKIGSIRPDDRVELGMQANTAKRGDVTERLEDGAIKLPAQVDFTSETIAEAEPDHIVSDVSGVNEADQSLHLDYSSGAIGFRG